MRVLFVGDIHNHNYVFQDIEILDKQFNFDRIICMGDYVDDWNTDNHQSLETLERIFTLKNLDREKYTFLVGNHELSYLGYECSGHDYNLEDVMEMKLKENIDLLDFYTSVQCGDREYICTHAGITNDYINKMLDGPDKWRTELDKMNTDKLHNLYLLSMVSSLRNGKCPFSSFVWADLREHIYYNKQEEPIIPNQIIGHTPVRTIVDENSFIFIDTHSTYRDGTPIGDKSYLIWDDDIFKTIKV